MTTDQQTTDETETETDAEICGADTRAGDPCQNPAGDNGRCWVPSHNPDADAEENPGGRPPALDEENREAVYGAARLGMKIKHQAAAAGVSPKTLRRHACCLETLREPELTTDDPCEFCRGYARAHAEGAQTVLEECRPEFVASATFGYTETAEKEVQHTGEGGGPIEIEFSEEVVETPYSERSDDGEAEVAVEPVDEVD